LPTDTTRGQQSLFVLAILVAAALRLYQVHEQILGGDEMHSVNSVRNHGLMWIFLHIGTADHCIPLTLLNELISETFGMNEMWMRAPSLMAGIGAVIVLPPLLARLVGSRPALVFAWLLAISPFHVYFSRFARPYAISFLLVTVGVLAFYRWWTSGERRWAVLYAGCAILQPWFLMPHAPFVLTPLGWGLAARLLPGERGGNTPSLRRVVRLGVIVALGIAALLGPPLVVDFGAVGLKLAEDSVNVHTLRWSFDLLSGAQLPVLLVGFVLALIVGWVALSLRAPRFAAYLLFVATIHAAAVAIVEPRAVSIPVVFARYTLPELFPLLLGVAAGLDALDTAVRRMWPRLGPGWLAVTCSLSLLAFGPLLLVHDPANRTYYSPNNWIHHRLFTDSYNLERRSRYADRLPLVPGMAFYERLTDNGSSDEAIVEFPSDLRWNFIPSVLGQRIHGRRVLVGLGKEDLERGHWAAGSRRVPWPDERFDFRNLVHVEDIEGMAERGVRYVVFRKNLNAFSRQNNKQSFPVDRWVSAYDLAFGPAVYDDLDVVVFDLLPSSDESTLLSSFLIRAHIARAMAEVAAKGWQVFWHTKNQKGFTEAQSKFFSINADHKGRFSLVAELPSDLNMLRVDPPFHSALHLRIHDIELEVNQRKHRIQISDLRHKQMLQEEDSLVVHQKNDPRFYLPIIKYLGDSGDTGITVKVEFEADLVVEGVVLPLADFLTKAGNTGAAESLIRSRTDSLFRQASKKIIDGWELELRWRAEHTTLVQNLIGHYDNNRWTEIWKSLKEIWKFYSVWKENKELYEKKQIREFSIQPDADGINTIVMSVDPVITTTIRIDPPKNSMLIISGIKLRINGQPIELTEGMIEYANMYERDGYIWQTGFDKPRFYLKVAGLLGNISQTEVPIELELKASLSDKFGNTRLVTNTMIDDHINSAE